MVSNVDEYIRSFPQEIQEILIKTREVIKKAAPDATEKISWSMPTYKMKSNLVHFAAQKKHLGFYPSPEAIIHFEKDLEQYVTTKGGVQFPYKDPIPYKLIEKITRYRVKLDEK